MLVEHVPACPSTKYSWGWRPHIASRKHTNKTHMKPAKQETLEEACVVLEDHESYKNLN